jgi:DNA-directed RNA polymerase subunit H (RpoH/RPB5)
VIVTESLTIEHNAAIPPIVAVHPFAEDTDISAGKIIEIFPLSTLFGKSFTVVKLSSSGQEARILSQS